MYSRFQGSISQYLNVGASSVDAALNGKEWSTKTVLSDKLIQNNPWGALSKTHLPGGPIRGFTLETGGDEFGISRYRFPRNRYLPGKVIAYPEVISGNKFGTNISDDSENGGLPMLVEELGHIYIDFAWEELTEYSDFAENPGVSNVAFETFLMSGDPDPIVGPGHPDHDRLNSQVELELMVWMKEPRHEDPDIGIVPGQIVGNFDVRDHVTGQSHPFTVYRNGPAYVAFIADEPWLSGRFCWSDLLKACIERADEWDLVNIKPEWRIGAVEFGSELWTGVGAWIAKQFDVDVQRATESTNTLPDKPNTDVYARLARCHLELAELYQDLSLKV